MFGEVRSLLQQAPTAQNWEALCQHVSDWGEPGFAESALPYILSHLERWPDHLRRAPLRWAEGLARGAALEFAPMVRVLDARALNLKNEDMWTLARAPIMKHVTGLNLAHNPIGWRGLSHLFDTPEPVAPQLRALDVGASAVGGEGVRLLASSQALRGLKSLALTQLSLSPASLAALSQSEVLGELKALHLGGNDFGERHLEAVSRGELIAGLETLALDRNPLGARGGLWMLRHMGLAHLKALGLRGCELPGGLIGALGRPGTLDEVHTLCLSGNQGLSALADLARARGLRHLRALEVEGASAAAAQAVAVSAQLPALHIIAAQGEVIDPALKERAAMHDRRVVEGPFSLYHSECGDWV